MQPRSRRAVVVSGAVVLAVIAAVYLWQATRAPGRSGRPAAARTSASASPRPTVPVVSQLPASTSDLMKACEGKGVAYSAAPAYAGSGPHPIAVFLSSAPADSVPSALPGPASRWLPDSTKNVQLIGCVQLSDKGPKSDVTCAYNFLGAPGPVPVFNGRYTITVYDLREHRKIASIEATGTDHSCPKKIPVIDTLFSGLTAARLNKLLAPYVNHSA
jgi:hypothetical protein